MEPSRQRILILSDTHLGRPDRGGRSAEALRPLWQGVDRLIVNGDIAEINDHTCRVQAAREVMKIQAYCEEDGVELELLSGNHDPMISDIRQMTLFAGEVFITHGDVLHPAISPWNTGSGHLQEINESARLWLDPDARESFEGQAAAAQFAALQKWDELAMHPEDKPNPVSRAVGMSIKVARVMWYWHTLPRRAADFIAEHAPNTRFFIFGHIHRSGIWHIDDRVIINTGSYDFPSKPHGVIIENGELGVWPIQPDGDVFRFADAPIESFSIYARNAA